MCELDPVCLLQEVEEEEEILFNVCPVGDGSLQM